MRAHTDHPASHAGGGRGFAGCRRSQDGRRSTALAAPGSPHRRRGRRTRLRRGPAVVHGIYAAMFGGMIMMHVGGHGGHGAYGGGRAGHGDPSPHAEDLSAHSSGPQPPGSAFEGEFDHRDSADGSIRGRVVVEAA